MVAQDSESRSNEAFDPGAALRRLDALIDAQLALVMNHPAAVALCEAWRALFWLVERVPEDALIHVAILPVTLRELHDDMVCPRRKQALRQHLVRDVYEDSGGFPWTVFAVHAELTVGDELLIEAMAELAEASSSAALLNAAPALVTGWSPPPRREQLRYAALLAPAIPQGSWSLPASHAMLASMAQSFTAYRHESNCVGADGHFELDADIPSRTKEDAMALAARGIASWSGQGTAAEFAALPSLVLARDVGGFGPHDGWLEASLPYLLYALRFVRITRLAAHRLTAEHDVAWEASRILNHFVNDSAVHDAAFRRAHPLRAVHVKWIDGELWAALTPTFKFQGCLFRVKLRIPLPPRLRTG